MFEKLRLNKIEYENGVLSKISWFFYAGLCGVIPKIMLLPISIIKKRFQV